MSPQSRRLAGILLLLMPAVVYGGASILSPLIGDPAYAENQLRQDLWRGVRSWLPRSCYRRRSSSPSSLPRPRGRYH